MILPDFKLVEWAAKGGIEPYNANHINPASINLCWSGKFRVAQPDAWSPLTQTDSIFEFLPGAFYLLDTLEYIKMPNNCAGFLALRSSMGRLGLEHLHAGWVDPGFEGTLTMEIEVRAPWPITLRKKQPIVQLILERLEAMPNKIYQGRYKYQKVPTGQRG